MAEPSSSPVFGENPWITVGNDQEQKNDASYDAFMAAIRREPVVIKSLHRFRDVIPNTEDLTLLSSGEKIKFYVSRTDLAVHKGYIVVSVKDALHYK